MTASVVIFAVGNRSRGDDAAAPLLLDRLGNWLGAQGLEGEFGLFEEYQLQVENALDLEGRRLVLFIDALRGAAAHTTVLPVVATAALARHSTHALAPGAVLGVYSRVTGEEPPPAFVLGLRAKEFELGAPLSCIAREAVEDGWTLLRSLCRCPRVARWQAISAACRAPRHAFAENFLSRDDP